MTKGPSRAARLLRFILPLRKEERRLARLRRAIFLAVLGVLLAVGLLTLLYYQTDWFGVRQVEVRGCSRLDPEYIRSLSGISRASRWLGLDREGAERAIASEHWVKEVDVARAFPLKCVITVSERSGAARVASAGRWYSVDGEGTVLEELAPGDATLVAVQELPWLAVVAGDRIEEDEFHQVMELLEGMPPELREQLATAGIDDAGDLKLQLKSTTYVLFGPPENVSAKQKVIKAILQDASIDCSTLQYIDVRLPDHPVIKPF
ncbi:MAG: cell division protein FtsQ/DivIB [Candidatus Geothermincolia bacterium]